MKSRQLIDPATIYDLELAQHNEDIAFFVETAQQYGGPVLEIGCGTGRLSLPLAEAGLDVTALDKSTNMLGRLKDKLAGTPSEVKGRIKMIQADMTRTALHSRFRLAICSSNTILLAASQQALEETLACIRSHLEYGGKLALDVAAMDMDTVAALVEYPDVEAPDLEFSSVKAERSFQRTHTVKILGAPNQVSVRYKYYDENGVLCSERREDVILLTPDELLKTLNEEGYEIVDTFGWYDRRPFSPGARKLLVIVQNKDIY